MHHVHATDITETRRDTWYQRRLVVSGTVVYDTIIALSNTSCVPLLTANASCYYCCCNCFYCLLQGTEVNSMMNGVDKASIGSDAKLGAEIEGDNGTHGITEVSTKLNSHIM
jgi:hypothetical protein